MLAVPSQAIATSEGGDFCYVVKKEGIERRAVVLGASSHDVKEVVEGLREGEVVLLMPREVVAKDLLKVTPTIPEPDEKEVVIPTDSEVPRLRTL